MQISTHTRPSYTSDKLISALDSLKRSAQDWDRAEQSSDRVDRYVQTADREFDSAEFPARQASYDNERTDSSFQGRQLERHFRTGGNALDNSQFDLNSAQRHLRSTETGIDSGQISLQDLAREYKESGNTKSLAEVQSAQRELLSSEQSFGNVERDWRSADSTLRFTKPTIDRADFDISRISWDRPGTNVSHHGRQVSNTINSVQMDLFRLESDLRRSGSNGNQGEGHLDRAISILENLSRAATSE